MDIRRIAGTEYEGELGILTATLPSGRKIVIECYGPKVRYRETVEAASINWPGIGSVDPEDADAFAAAIAEAAGLARDLKPSNEARKLAAQA